MAYDIKLKTEDIKQKSENALELFFSGIKSEQTKDSMVHGYMRWKSRLHAADLIGIPIYTMTKYPKINRVTMPCGDKNLLMFST